MFVVLSCWCVMVIVGFFLLISVSMIRLGLRVIIVLIDRL